jgi:YHS domain-containing protein
MASLSAYSQSEEVRQKHYNLKKGLSLEGYDPVSYFSGHPVEGRSELRYTYRGVMYQFATPTNLAKFKNAPDGFEPAFGGWCAYAMGETGEKVKIDPETFKVLDGKLYVFYNFWGNNTLTDWNKNEVALKAKGDKNWKKFVP